MLLLDSKHQESSDETTPTIRVFDVGIGSGSQHTVDIGRTLEEFNKDADAAISASRDIVKNGGSVRLPDVTQLRKAAARLIWFAKKIERLKEEVATGVYDSTD